jgi:hypothetical protein
MIVEDHDMSYRILPFDDGRRRNHEDPLLFQRCGICQPLGSNDHHSFLKRSKTDISRKLEDSPPALFWRIADQS